MFDISELCVGDLLGPAALVMKVSGACASLECKTA